MVAGKFLLLFEQDLTLGLQKLRRDLYVLHSAVLEWGAKLACWWRPQGAGNPP